MILYRLSSIVSRLPQEQRHLRIRKAVLFCLCEQLSRQAFQIVLRNLSLDRDNLGHLLHEPRVVAARAGHLLHRRARPQRLGHREDPAGQRRASRQSRATQF